MPRPTSTASSRAWPSVDKTIKVSKTWTGSFSDVALMTEAAKTHIAAGADVLTGSSQSVVGSIGAAKDKGSVLWFGTQADQASLAPDLVVASQVYDWTGILKDMIAKYKAGKLGGETFMLQPVQRRPEDRLQPGLQPARRRQGGRRRGHRRHQGRHDQGAAVELDSEPSILERRGRSEQAAGPAPPMPISSRRISHGIASRNPSCRRTASSTWRCATSSSASPACWPTTASDFDVRAGEVHALLGENGAGKSTLMRQLYGLYQPDAGQILVDGQPLSFHSPADAIRAGIGMVHQHFMLVPTLTVAENVALGLPSSRGPLMDLDRVSARIRELAAAYGLKVDPSCPVWQLAVGEQQRVEIIKALYRGASVIILDEPTAVLTPQEVDDLFVTLRRMAAEGHSLIFISHKLHEVMAISDRVTVLRDGQGGRHARHRRTSRATSWRR